MALRMVTRTAGPNRALKDGRVRVEGLAFEEVPVLVQAFRRMVRGLEWDACEMALTTYLVAREHGVRFTALPIVITTWAGRPQVEFRALTSAAIIVLLAVVLLFNAGAILLRNRYEKKRR